MSILSKLTVKPLLWVIGVLLVACFALAIGLYVQSTTSRASIATAQADTDKAKAALEVASKGLAAAVSANASSGAAITELQQRLSDAVGRRQQVQAALDKAETERDSARAARNAAAAALKTEREKTYATDQSCADWGARPVCGAISNGLQDQWRQAAGGD